MRGIESGDRAERGGIGVDTMRQSNLDRAIGALNAIELASDNYAYYADETSTWWVVTPSELEEYCDYLDSDDEQVSRNAYSHWCAGTSAREQPRGWTP